MNRLSSVLVLALASCGSGVEVEPSPGAPPVEAQATLTPATPEPVDQVVVHGLASPDGTQVTWFLGYLSCGIIEVGHGVASTVGGAFSFTWDADEVESLPFVKLFVLVDRDGDGRCTDGVDDILDADVTLPGAVDLSSPTPTFFGCWLFDSLAQR